MDSTVEDAFGARSTERSEELVRQIQVAMDKQRIGESVSNIINAMRNYTLKIKVET